MSEFLIYNGEYFDADKPILTVKNRAFKYGDSLFETMYATGGKIPLFYYHIDRLIKSMKILKMEIPAKFTSDTIGLNEEIVRLITKNRFFYGARVRFSVFRNDGGLYTPENNEVSYIIEVSPLKNTKFELNQIGLKIDVFEQYKKQLNKLSNLKTSNSILYILASLHRKSYFFDDMLLLNENNYLIEAISSNLFICKDNVVYTPAISEGCVAGVMRRKVIEKAKQNDIKIIDDCMLTSENLLLSDEIFLTNAVSGIKWVGAFRERRYYNRISKNLLTLLNDEFFGNK